MNQHLSFLDGLVYTKGDDSLGHTIYRNQTYTNRYLKAITLRSFKLSWKPWSHDHKKYHTPITRTPTRIFVQQHEANFRPTEPKTVEPEENKLTFRTWKEPPTRKNVHRPQKDQIHFTQLKNDTQPGKPRSLWLLCRDCDQTYIGQTTEG